MSNDLEHRVSQLEARVAQLEGRPAPTPAPAPPAAPAPRDPRPAPQSVPAPAPTTAPEKYENWLGRAGIALVVVGFILLYRYAVERGWLTPQLRIATGLITGTALLTAGIKYLPDRRRYRQILIAGGLSVLFITGIAAEQLYHLVSGPVALAYLIAVAGIGFTIAQYQREPIIASIAGLGSLLASLWLKTAVPEPTMWYYITVISAWAGVLCLLRNWQDVYVITGLATFIAMMVNAVNAHLQMGAVVAITVCWIVYAALPLLVNTTLSRRVLDFLPIIATLALGFIADRLLRHKHMFEISAALDAVGFALIALIAPIASPRRTAAILASAAAIAAASAFYLNGAWSFLALAIIGMWCVALVDRIHAPPLYYLAHVLFGIVGMAFLQDVELFNRKPAFDNFAISFFLAACFAGATAWDLQAEAEHPSHPHPQAVQVYWIAVYLVVHVLLATELSAVVGAPWLATAAYAVVGSALLIGGLAKRQMLIQRAGLLSLGLTVVRLFLYDLDNVDVGVRIILFMACGAAFLGLSYLVRSRRFAT